MPFDHNVNINLASMMRMTCGRLTPEAASILPHLLLESERFPVVAVNVLEIVFQICETGRASVIAVANLLVGIQSIRGLICNKVRDFVLHKGFDADSIVGSSRINHHVVPFRAISRILRSMIMPVMCAVMGKVSRIPTETFMQ